MTETFRRPLTQDECELLGLDGRDGAGTYWLSATANEFQFETVTVVVEWEPGRMRRPSEWDWDTLVDGKARAIESREANDDELARAFPTLWLEFEKEAGDVRDADD